jgi:hypothetical protein
MHFLHILNNLFSQTKRKAIIVQMYDTEKSYVEALKILVNVKKIISQSDRIDFYLINIYFRNTICQ